MSWQPAEDPKPGDRFGCDAIETVIMPRARDLGGFEVRRALPSANRQMVGPFIFWDQMGPAEGRARRTSNPPRSRARGVDHGLDRIAAKPSPGLGILRGLPAHSSLPGSSGAVPVGWPAGPMVIFSIRASARLRSASQCFFRASPRS